MNLAAMARCMPLSINALSLVLALRVAAGAGELPDVFSEEVARLVQLARSPRPELRVEAAQGLYWLGHTAGEAPLLPLASDRDPDVRLAAVRALTMRYGGVALLKGAGTLIDDGQQIDLCAGANPGLASGGMGDVLTGLIAGLLAQGLPLADAARGAVRLQLHAGALAARALGAPGMLAGDLLERIAPLLTRDGACHV